MNRVKKILIIEDESDISKIVKAYMQKNGYEAAVADTGKDGLHIMEILQPDYIILDIMLPDIDGIDLCRQIREKNNTPILILSARSSDTDKVLGLGFGADDYMTKPFSLSELLARINAHFRRYELMTEKPIGDEHCYDHPLIVGNISIFTKEYRVTVNELDVSLSAKEFELLHYLAEHKNQVFSKAQLLDTVWGYSTYVDENTVTVYIHRLREKIEIDPSNPVYIKTVWGIGYKFSLS